MKFPLYRDLVLAGDLPEHRLRQGDLVRPVEYHVSRGGEGGYSVEILGATGQTLGVVAVREALLENVKAGEVLSARVW